MVRFLSTILFFIFYASTGASHAEWQKQACPVTDDLHNVFLINDSVGWIITHKTGAVLHTKNGGNTWIVQAELDSMFLESIYFLDERIGWVSGQYGLLFKTTDGGENWERHKISEDDSWIYSVYFFNEEQGIAVGLREGERPFKPVFLKTDSGGINWNNLEPKVPTTGYEPIFFLSNREGFVGGGGYILHTKDAGSSWEIKYSDTPKYCRTIRGLYFLNTQIGWAVGACGLVLKTDDGGNSWQRTEKFTKNDLRSVTFVNESEGFIVGDGNREKGVLFQTIDGGQNWQVSTSDYPDLHRIRLTENRIWIVGKKGTILVKTR